MRISIRKYLFVSILIFTFTNFGQQKISPLPKGVSIHTLDNGLQVLLIENHTLPMAGINTVVKVGSAYETFATSGMSHMLEHLLFNGTTTMSQRELYNAVDLIGGYNNANTSEYYTNFMMVTPADKIYDGLKIQADMLFNSTLPEKKYPKEKGIVLEEINKTLSNPNEQLERNLISVLYKGHALSLPTLGTYETIVHMKRDDVFSFYKNYYVPNNMLVSVIGNFNTEEMLKKLNEIFGKYAPSTVQRPTVSDWAAGFKKPVRGKENNIAYKFYDGKSFHLQMAFPLPNNYSAEFYSILEDKYSALSSNLKNKINAKYENSVKQLSISVRQTPIANHLLLDFTIPNETKSDGIIDFITRELPAIKLKVTKEEVSSMIAEEKTSFFRNIEKPHMFGIYNAYTIAVKGFMPIVEKFSGENYLTAAKRINNFTLNSQPIVILQIPTKSVLPQQNNSEITTKLFPSKRGTPTLIVRTNQQSKLLSVHFLLGHKSEYEAKYGANAAYVWHEAFGEKIKADAAEGNAAKFGFVFTVNDNPFIPMDNIYLSPEFGYIRAEGLSDNLTEALNFLKNEMLNFVPTEKEFKNALSSLRRSQMMKHTNRAKSVFNALLDSVIYNKNSKQSHTQLTYKSLLQFGERYFNPENMVAAVVSAGNGKTVESVFSDFRKSAPKDIITTQPQKVTFKTIDAPKTITKKLNAKRAYLYYGFQKNVLSNEKAALKVLSLILSDKIVFDIRETQGLAYNMGAGVETLGNKAMFYINMGTRVENVDKLIKQFPEKFTTDYLGKITEEEMTKRLNMYLGRMLFRRLSSINQGFYLCKSFYFNRDYKADEKFLDELKNVKLANVRKVAEKYLHEKNPIYIIVK